MTNDRGFEIFPARSQASRYWDYVCAGILLVPLVLLAFQGDLIFGLAERINYKGWFTEIREREAALSAVKAAVAQATAYAQQLDRSMPNYQEERRAAAFRESTLRRQQEKLEGEIKSLRKPFEDRAAYWNFSFVRRWPLVLLLGPLLLAMIWLGVPAADRQQLYDEALRTGARNRGVLLGLLAVVVFWFGVWQQNALDRDLLDHLGTPGYTPAFWRRYAFVLTYLSLAGWSAAGIYAFAGPRGLRRAWLPGAVAMALLIINYGAMSGWWAYLWDKKDQWSYGYLIGPIAAALFYYKVTESEKPRAPNLGKGLGFAGAGLVCLLIVAGVVKLVGQVDISIVIFLCFLGALGIALGGNGVLHCVWGRRERILLAWGVLGFVGIVGAWLVADRIGRGAPVLWFMPVPAALCGGVAVLGLWQLYDRGRRGELAMRLAGLAMVLASVVFYGLALSRRIHYFAEISIVGVLVGGALAVMGYELFRRAWVALAFIYLAIPWPERAYVELAIKPQTLAAEMAVRFLKMFYGGTVARDGTVIIVGPTLEDRLEVAQQCSGLQMLFAFVALSVVYAYISKRRPWRRLVVFISSFPIAVVANVARVTIMAFSYRLGFREITQGLGHEMAGFVIMLPLAFALLYLEMRALDLLEKVAAHLTHEESDGSGSGADAEKAA